MNSFMLPRSPFELEKATVEEMLEEIRPVRHAELGAMKKRTRRLLWTKRLTDEQKRAIGRSSGARDPVARRYGVGVDYVSELRGRMKKGEL